ncbi:MAG TPA: LytTR family DNA-binding domain-containing protein [Caulobacterales bacterium]|nr:LytTR family DNA-binding domain-containing protein [Caulobacterales bacterium]
MNGWAVTSGLGWAPWLAVAALGLAVALVNATSRLMETARDGDAVPGWAPFVWEFSSLALLLALAPLIGAAVAGYPPRRDRLARFVAVHAALTVPYSVLHVGGMVALRKLAYALAGTAYDFSHGDLAREFFYEWRKDVLSYAIVAAVYWYFQRRAEAGQASADRRIEIRDGTSAVYLPPSDILWVEAAGNYVQFHTSAKTHLVRATLAAWEAKLAAQGIVRVHRSRLVNRARIRALKPTPAGDVEITLDDGRAVIGSRRYREALDTAQNP